MPLKTHVDEAPTLNLTPMIDIVFLIIIFFMVGTKFTDVERSIDFQLPKVGENTPLTPPPPRRLITLYADGTISYQREKVSAAPPDGTADQSDRQLRRPGSNHPRRRRQPDAKPGHSDERLRDGQH